jgi:hypothetical protein
MTDVTSKVMPDVAPPSHAALDKALGSPRVRRALKRLVAEGRLPMTGRFFGRRGDKRHELVRIHTASVMERAGLARIGMTGRARRFVLCLTPRGRRFAPGKDAR